MIVAVYEHRRLSEIVVEDLPERVIEHLPLRRRERNAEVLRDIPVREQRELAGEQCFVVGRKLTSTGRLLPANERIDRVAVEVGRGLRIELGQICPTPEIGEQQ